MTRRILILALLFSIVACGSDKKTAIQGRAKETEAAARRATVTTGTAKGEKYSGTYEITPGSAKVECAANTGGTAERHLDVGRNSIECTQADGKLSCTDSDDGTKLDGYLNMDGSFEMSGPAFGAWLKELDLNGNGVLKGRFADPDSDSPQSASGELRASIRVRKDNRSATCNLLASISLKRAGSPDRGSARIQADVAELRLHSTDKKRTVSYFSKIVRSKSGKGRMQVVAEPAPGERFEATLYNDGSAEVSSALKSSDGQSALSIDHQSCDFESADEGNGGTTYAVTCPDLDATLTLPAR